MKALLILLSPLWFTTAHAWTSIQSQTPFLRNKQMAMSYQEDAIPENPCTWQDVADGEDCAMEHIYGASFVASKWLKTMPCAEGIEVRHSTIKQQEQSIHRYSQLRSFDDRIVICQVTWRHPRIDQKQPNMMWMLWTSWDWKEQSISEKLEKTRNSNRNNKIKAAECDECFLTQKRLICTHTVALTSLKKFYYLHEQLRLEVLAVDAVEEQC